MTNPDLVRWLNLATRGLPADVAASVRAEFEAHYEDALLEHQSRGLNDFEAHRHALAELGDAREAARALHDTHLAERRYLKAALASIAPSIALLVVVFMGQAAGDRVTEPSDFFDATIWLGFLTFFAVAYVLRVFKVLLSGQFNVYQIDRPVALVTIGLLIVTAMSLASRVLFDRQVAVLVNDPMIVEMPLRITAGVSLENIVNIFNVAGILTLGLGWLWLSDRLVMIEDRTYGLLKPLRYLLLISGFGIISSGIASLLGLTNANYLALMVLAVVGVCKYAAWTLLFFRAAYRGSNRPIQTA